MSIEFILSNGQYTFDNRWNCPSGGPTLRETQASVYIKLEWSIVFL